MVKIKDTLAAVVTAARCARFWTQAQLAEVSDVSESTIANVERGTTKTLTPRIASMLGQKKALNVDLSEYTNQ